MYWNSCIFVFYLTLDFKRIIHGSTSFNFCWATIVERGCDLLNTHSTFVEQQLRILKMADDEMLLSACAARVGVVKKRVTEKFELEIAIKKIKPLSGNLLYTYNCRTPAKSRCINLQKFRPHGFYVFEGTSLVRNTSYHSPDQEMKTRSAITTQRKACHNALNTA